MVGTKKKPSFRQVYPNSFTNTELHRVLDHDDDDHDEVVAEATRLLSRYDTAVGRAMSMHNSNLLRRVVPKQVTRGDAQAFTTGNVQLIALEFVEQQGRVPGHFVVKCKYAFNKFMVSSFRWRI